MTYDEHIEDVCQRAIQARGQSPLGIYTRTGHKKVMVGLARPDHAWVMEIDITEYDGRRLLELAGVSL
jgi:hypothetical protein